MKNQNLILLTTIALLGALYLKTKSSFDFSETFDEAVDMIKELNPLSTQLIIRIDRYLLTDNKTIGKMYLNNEYFCDTLEDTYRGQDLSNTKVYGATAIPNGTYRTVVNFSPKFNKQMPQLLNVPYFTGIRIHTGSSEKDTDGCIIVGNYNNGKWSANSEYVYKLTALIPQYSLCKKIINII